MADVKISALPASTTPLAGTEVLPIVQSGTTVKVSVANLTAGRAISSGRATIDTLTIGLGGQTSVATNTALGFEALNSASLTGDNSVAVGYRALLANTSGASNSVVGVSALSNNTTGSSNSALGRNALLYYNTSNNTAVGFEAARGSTTVANNTGFNLTAVGYQALTANTSGTNNSAIGRGALKSNTGADNVTAVGHQALFANTTGSNNSALGQNALVDTTTGANNSAVGHTAGDVITTGARNTIIGQGSDPSANNGNDQTVVGQGLTGKGDDTAFIGGTNGAYNEKNVTTWETTSDQRIKKNIVSNALGLEILSQIDVRNFEYRTADEITDLPASAAINQSGTQLGVIAQELQAVLPQCVTENSTGVLSVNTDPLIWYLVNSVKQLSAKVAELEGA